MSYKDRHTDHGYFAHKYDELYVHWFWDIFDHKNYPGDINRIGVEKEFLRWLRDEGWLNVLESEELTEEDVINFTISL